MSQPDPICPICNQEVAAGIPVVFDHGTVVHLDCYVGTESGATLVHNFLGSKPGERFCYTCLAQHLTRDRHEIEKASHVLRLTRRVVVEPAICVACTNARVTSRMRKEADGARSA